MKLTLNIEPVLTAQMKQVAKKRKTSVSKIVEGFFKNEVIKDAVPVQLKNKDQFPEWMQQLIIAKEPTPDFDHKAEYHKHLEKKYGL